MRIAFYLASWYLAILLPGMAGWRLLTMLGVSAGRAWLCGRAVALVIATLAAWWIGVLGVTRWLPAGAAILGAGAVAAVLTIELRKFPWKEVVRLEVIFVLGFTAILLLRWSHPEIRGTEKPMDFAILNTLLHSRGFPPPDFWLSGGSLPYYYWGQLLWTIPIRLSGVPPEYAYNLIAATVGGLVLVSSWSIARSLGAGTAGAWLGGFLNLLAGTPDGLRQLAVSRSIDGIDLWRSSRQVGNAITEYPLFTAWLGDLHAHFLVLPVFLATIALCLKPREAFASVGGIILVGACLGVAAATNPWSFPVLAAAIALLAVNPHTRFPWNIGRALATPACLGLVLVVAWLCTAPFFVSFEPPFQGLGLVHTRTLTTNLLSYAGTLLVPVGIFLYLRFAGLQADRAAASARALTVAGAVVLAAAVSGRPVLVTLAAMLALLAWLALVHRDDGSLDAVLLAALGIGLLLAPELVYVKDTYGVSLYRMNTVFKSYFQAWILLAPAVPVLLENALRQLHVRRLAYAAIVLASLPHLLSALASVRGSSGGLDGLAWMTREDRMIVDFLRGRDGTILEAVGPAYSDAGRISSATGSPAFLGWANHEIVWRGRGITGEVERRARVADAIYTSGDVQVIRNLTNRESIRFVVVGSRELASYDEGRLEALAGAGATVLRAGAARVVRFPQ